MFPQSDAGFEGSETNSYNVVLCYSFSLYFFMLCYLTWFLMLTIFYVIFLHKISRLTLLYIFKVKIMVILKLASYTPPWSTEKSQLWSMAPKITCFLLEPSISFSYSRFYLFKNQTRKTKASHLLTQSLLNALRAGVGASGNPKPGSRNLVLRSLHSERAGPESSPAASTI